jgi:hypothetical protein
MSAYNCNEPGCRCLDCRRERESDSDEETEEEENKVEKLEERLGKTENEFRVLVEKGIEVDKLLMEEIADIKERLRQFSKLEDKYRRLEEDYQRVSKDNWKDYREREELDKHYRELTQRVVFMEEDYKQGYHLIDKQLRKNVKKDDWKIYSDSVREHERTIIKLDATRLKTEIERQKAEIDYAKQLAMQNKIDLNNVVENFTEKFGNVYTHIHEQRMSLLESMNRREETQKEKWEANEEKIKQILEENRTQKERLDDLEKRLESSRKFNSSSLGVSDPENY